MTDVRHLYVHLPFCVHRCGYCDFVTSVGRETEHLPYAEALVAELEWGRPLLADPLETIFIGGGTPTFMRPDALRTVLRALPDALEVTVEANPETVTPEVVASLREHRVNRVSLGAQSFQQPLLETLERVARPDDVRRAVHTLRDAEFDNISLDLIYGIPGQSGDDLAAWRSSPSTSPPTSSRRSPARDSPTSMGPSSTGRRRLWRATSTPSSRR